MYDLLIGPGPPLTSSNFTIVVDPESTAFSVEDAILDQADAASGFTASGHNLGWRTLTQGNPGAGEFDQAILHSNGIPSPAGYAGDTYMAAVIDNGGNDPNNGHHDGWWEHSNAPAGNPTLTMGFTVGAGQAGNFQLDLALGHTTASTDSVYAKIVDSAGSLVNLVDDQTGYGTYDGYVLVSSSTSNATTDVINGYNAGIWELAAEGDYELVLAMRESGTVFDRAFLTSPNDPNDPTVVDVPSFSPVAFWVLIALLLGVGRIRVRRA
ncbi:MAG: hypothetical protein CL938_03140 [Deltaproteobacteria bacterium]|jgi:hypothetical protein|nr:hypothetical protein [Deltaproteobacteria bacterium]HJO22855.1 hypothetical protein [Myxococcota bacterium]